MVCHDQGMRKRARFGGGPWAAAKKMAWHCIGRRMRKSSHSAISLGKEATERLTAPGQEARWQQSGYRPGRAGA